MIDLRPHSARSRSLLFSIVHYELFRLAIQSRFLVVDETAHVPARLLHWNTGEFGLYRVDPPSPRMIAVVPLWFDQPQFDFDRVQANPGTRIDSEVGEIGSPDLMTIEVDRRD